MLLFLQLLLVALLVIVFVQDMKYRAVSWIIFPVLGSLAISINCLQLPYREVVLNSVSNFELVFFIFLLVTIYFSVKHRRWVNVTKELIGWGDLLFFLFLVVFFSPMNFIFFFTITLLLISLGGAGYIVFKKVEQPQIPLAGLQALFLITLIIINYLVKTFSFHSDDWILSVLY